MTRPRRLETTSHAQTFLHMVLLDIMGQVYVLMGCRGLWKTLHTQGVLMVPCE